MKMWLAGRKSFREQKAAKHFFFSFMVILLLTLVHIFCIERAINAIIMGVFI